MRNKAIAGTQPPDETSALSSLRDQLTELLPGTWKLRFDPPASDDRLDALLEIEGPEGIRASVAVEYRRAIEPRDVRLAIEQLRRYAETVPMIAAPFLSPRTRALLAEAGASYADATGSLRLVLDRPAVFVERTGADKDPWPEERSLQSLKGPAAGRVVRALCDFRPPYGIRELAERCDTPASSVTRVVKLLEREALLDREPRGPIADVDWSGLLRRWTQDYAFDGSNDLAGFLDPRGLDALLEKLRASRLDYALTGSLAAGAVAPAAPARLATVYVRSTFEAADGLSLRPTDAGANVILAEPYDPVAFARSRTREGLRYAALSQVAADLLTGPGRTPAEADELLRWMAEHEDDWRT